MLPYRDKYLVIGGHGSVGRVVCQYLEAKFPGRVVAAGRSVDAAADFESVPRGRVTSIQLDVRDPVMLDAALNDTRVAITCVDARNREIAERVSDKERTSLTSLRVTRCCSPWKP